MYFTKFHSVLTLSAVIVAMSLLSTSTARAGDNAVVKGKIIFKGDAKKPAYGRKVIDTTKDANCAKTKKKIGSWRIILNKKTDPVTVRNVLVYVKSGLGDKKYAAPSTPVVLTQKGCEYSPHVLGVMAGQPFSIQNGDNTNHNIHFLPKKNEAYNFTQPKKDMKKNVKLDVEDAFHVKCDVHPWMGCWIQVFDHPFFAVTDKKGNFEIKGLLAGSYEIEAWHEVFGKVSMSVTVAQDETKEADLTFDRTDKD